jgi:hypothetical protein
MFSRLPDLLDRNFAIGYFLPGGVLTICLIVMLEKAGYLNILPTDFVLDDVNLLIGSTVIGGVSWVFGIVLLAVNRDIVRFLEGYGRYNPLNFLKWVQHYRYKRLNDAVEKLNEAYEQSADQGNEFPPEQLEHLTLLMRNVAESYPDDAQWLLPTKFGNVIRAFEIYPRQMHGIDAIPAWPRLQAVISEDFAAQVDSAKARLDFWLNLVVVGFILLAFYSSFVLADKLPFMWTWFSLIVGVIVVAQLRMTSAALGWGEYVKAAFDVFLPELRRKLRFVAPADTIEEHEQWESFSQAILYRLPENLPKRDFTNKQDDSE